MNSSREIPDKASLGRTSSSSNDFPKSPPAERNRHSPRCSLTNSQSELLLILAAILNESPWILERLLVTPRHSVLSEPKLSTPSYHTQWNITNNSWRIEFLEKKNSSRKKLYFIQSNYSRAWIFFLVSCSKFHLNASLTSKFLEKERIPWKYYRNITNGTNSSPHNAIIRIEVVTGTRSAAESRGSEKWNSLTGQWARALFLLVYKSDIMRPELRLFHDLSPPPLVNA